MIPLGVQVKRNGDALAYGYTAGDLGAGKPTLIGEVLLRWSRPASVLPPDAAEGEFTLMCEAGDLALPVEIDDEITFTGQIGESGAAFELFRGAVDRITEAAPIRGRRVITVEVIDYIGRYNRVRFGDRPWRLENIYERAVRFEPLLPGFAASLDLPHGTHPDYFTAPTLDVDSRSPVEILQAHLTGYGFHLIGTEFGIGMRRLGLAPALALHHHREPNTTTLNPPATLDLPADAIRDVAQSTSYDSKISSMSVTWEVRSNSNTEGPRVTRVWGDGSIPGVSLKFDLLNSSPDQGPEDPFYGMTDEQIAALPPEQWPIPQKMVALAEALVQPDGPAMPRLEPLEVHLDQLPESSLYEVMTMMQASSRWDNAIRITDARPGIDPVQTVIGGALRIAGADRKSVLTLETEPLSLNGVAPLTFERLLPEMTWESFDPDISWTDLSAATTVRITNG